MYANIQHSTFNIQHSTFNIQQAASPGKRVLVIGGQGHIAVIRDFLASDTQRKAVFVDSFF